MHWHVHICQCLGWAICTWLLKSHICFPCCGWLGFNFRVFCTLPTAWEFILCSMDMHASTQASQKDGQHYAHGLHLHLRSMQKGAWWHLTWVLSNVSPNALCALRLTVNQCLFATSNRVCKWFRLCLFNSCALTQPLHTTPVSRWFVHVSHNSFIHLGFPAVIKPIFGAASIGVVRVDSMEQLHTQVMKVRQQLLSARVINGALQEGIIGDDEGCDAAAWIDLSIMMEQYLDGPEVCLPFYPLLWGLQTTPGALGCIQSIRGLCAKIRFP